jgi:hypothetical protein
MNEERYATTNHGLREVMDLIHTRDSFQPKSRDRLFTVSLSWQYVNVNYVNKHG